MDSDFGTYANLAQVFTTILTLAALIYTIHSFKNQKITNEVVNIGKSFDELLKLFEILHKNALDKEYVQLRFNLSIFLYRLNWLCLLINNKILKENYLINFLMPFIRDSSKFIEELKGKGELNLNNVNIEHYKELHYFMKSKVNGSH